MDTLDVPVVPKGLNSSELSYHTQLMGRLKKAQEAFQQAQVDLVKAQGAVDSWSEFLMGQYFLSVGDSVDADGQFVRKAQE